ncbi:MAG TPA: hypothetical protein VG963_22365 [Polyangiaceae bacterium]|nr:hypothetical protein [Polyangiaceae bacterium]
MRCQCGEDNPLQLTVCRRCGHVLGALSVSQLVVFDNQYMCLGQYSEPTFLLLELTGSPINNWSGGSGKLTGAHHIFPKSTLAWLWEHSTAQHQQFIRQVLNFDRNSGTGALARLRSNLISPIGSGGKQIAPDSRGDDPHHKFKYRIRPGEEGLDLVRTRGDNLEPRSALYRHLAWYVIHVIYPLYIESPDDFMLRDADVIHILHCLLNAERIHYYVEPDPTLPSHASAGLWALDDQGNYVKSLVAPLDLGSGRQMVERYRIRLAEERREQKERRANARRLGLPSSTQRAGRPAPTGELIDRSVQTPERDICVDGRYYSLREYISRFGLAHYSNQ